MRHDDLPEIPDEEEDQTVLPHKLIATVDLRVSRRQYDGMVRQARRARLSFDDWVSTVLSVAAGTNVLDLITQGMRRRPRKRKPRRKIQKP